MTVPVLVGVDWGTTNARAYVLAADGAILAQTEEQAGAALGIMHIKGADFSGALERLLAALPAEVAPELPILLSGMITSRQGWVETAYVDCPASFADVADAAERQTIEDRTLIFAPGLAYTDATGVHDVMRGEELQILGLLAMAGGDGDGVYCLPGTHSKWAWTAGGRIDRFSTVMTGEVYGALCNHTILGRLMGARSHHAEAFAQGASRARAGGYVLHDIFAARTEGLFERLRPDTLAAYLSGLLIGHEVAAMVARLDAGAPITVIGGAALAERYGTVLKAAGYQPTLRSDPVVARGQLELAKAMGAI
jgi:2-dehydro-3-deoxygalactonokinase